MNISLNDCQWQLKGYWPYVPLLGQSLELGNELMGVTEWIAATVPGGVHHDLYKAGLIENPYFEDNSLKCEWVENRWWMYKASFTIDSRFSEKNLTLVFKGVDYKAHFYLNKVKLGEHEGMYEAVTFDITGKVQFDRENEMVVLFENAPEEMSQIGRTSLTKTQKSRFNYKWDFSTRLVNIGIWDDVYLKAAGAFTLNDTSIGSGLENGTGYIDISSAIRGKAGETCTVKVFVDYKDKSICSLEENVVMQFNEYDFTKKLAVTDQQLWYPNGAGEQNLYKVRIELYQYNELSDAEDYATGLRSFEYRQNPGSTGDTLPYTFVINGSPVYIKGVNLVPFDHLYGNVTKEIYDHYVSLLKKANINLVRVWGGGIVEKEYFYSLCDLNGIMVWQEFIQSSSGVDCVPSKDPHFLKLLEATAVQAVKTKRNHVCHLVWSGGNELYDDKGIPITYEDLNIKMLKDIVEKYDPKKLFLPSSASGPNAYLNVDQPGKNHDVHGSWKYEGIEKQYAIYNKSDSLFHSEFGNDGLSSMDCLKKTLAEANLKVTDMKENLIWRHHGEWWDTLERDREIFGDFSSLEQFIKVSQFIQAEGLRYALEANRRRKFRNSGSIIWQFNEPWPNVSCTSLVDYYKNPKMAYYWVRDAYEPIHASLRYDKLYYRPEELFEGAVYIHNSLDEQEFTVSWEVLESTGRVIKTESITTRVKTNSALELKGINCAIPRLQSDIFFIRLRVHENAGKLHSQNLYVFSQLKEAIFSTLLHLSKPELKIEKLQDSYRIRNDGKEVCLFLHGVDKSVSENIFVENNYTSLFPGEEEVFQIQAVNSKDDSDIDDVCLEWDYLNKNY